jgi:hypothetical protein
MAYSNRRGRRYSRYSYDSGHQAAMRHIRAFRELERRLGPIVTDVKEAFLNLGNSDFNLLLAKYGELFGQSAQDYALQTYPKWRAGQTKMSGKVAERLLNLLPPYLKFEHRYAMVEKLCNHHATKQYRSVKINLKKPEAGLDELNRSIKEVLEISAVSEKYLPEHVLNTINWLNDDDMVISRQMLAEIDRKRNAKSLTLAEKEFQNVMEQVKNVKGEASFSQRIEIAGGTIVVSAEKKSLKALWITLGIIALYIIYRLSK